MQSQLFTFDSLRDELQTVKEFIEDERSFKAKESQSVHCKEIQGIWSKASGPRKLDPKNIAPRKLDPRHFGPMEIGPKTC